MDEVGGSDIPGFILEIIERGLSGDSRTPGLFVEIFEILKQNLRGGFEVCELD
jgi:hypothetical protein